MNNKLFIIIPVFNEKTTIEEIIKRVNRASTLEYEKEIIVVDDGSNDGTEEILKNLKQKYNFLLVRHCKNLGKGAAIKTALNKIKEGFVLIQDADLEYNPNDYPKLLQSLNKNHPVVYGSRNLKIRKKGYWIYVLGANFLNFLVNCLFAVKLTDIYTGYKLLPVCLIKNLNLTSQGFNFEMELTVKIIKKGIAIKEVPIDYHPRKFSQGKKIRPWDGFIGLYTIIKYRFKKLK